MIPRLLLIILVLGFIYWAYRRYEKLAPSEKRKWLMKLGIYGLAGVVLAAAVTGKIHWFGAIAAGALAMGRFGLRFLPFLRFLHAKNVLGNPVFRTPYLLVRVDLKSGTINGEILEGPHAGTPLEQLSTEVLEELQAYYAEKDKRSYYLVRVIRQRRDANFRNQQQQDYSAVGDPTQDEAILILGLEDIIKERSLTKEDVVHAHRKLIQKLHPDRGGNDYLAARVNQAKDVLLKQL